VSSSLTISTMKYKHGTKEYWMDWYWNRGGREKVLAKRYIAEYKREEKKHEEARRTSVC